MPKALVVDDEPFLILLMSDELQTAGFTVQSAFDAGEAFAVLSRDRDWDLLVTDIHMPGAVNGWELGRVAKTLIPDIKIIYASGISSPPAQLSRGEMFMAKPYELTDLVKCLRDVGLDVGAASDQGS